MAPMENHTHQILRYEIGLFHFTDRKGSYQCIYISIYIYLSLSLYLVSVSLSLSLSRSLLEG